MSVDGKKVVEAQQGGREHGREEEGGPAVLPPM
jgi:hypothetical protein